MELSKLNLLESVKQDLQAMPIETIESWASLDRLRDEHGRVSGTDNDYKGVKFYLNTEAKQILDRICHITGTNQSQLVRNLIINYLISLRND